MTTTRAVQESFKTQKKSCSDIETGKIDSEASEYFGIFPASTDLLTSDHLTKTKPISALEKESPELYNLLKEISSAREFEFEKSSDIRTKMSTKDKIRYKTAISFYKSKIYFNTNPHYAKAKLFRTDFHITQKGGFSKWLLGTKLNQQIQEAYSAADLRAKKSSQRLYSITKKLSKQA